MRIWVRQAVLLIWIGFSKTQSCICTAVYQSLFKPLIAVHGMVRTEPRQLWISIERLLRHFAVKFLVSFTWGQRQGWSFPLAVCNFVLGWPVTDDGPFVIWKLSWLVIVLCGIRCPYRFLKSSASSGLAETMGEAEPAKLVVKEHEAGLIFTRVA